MIDFYDNMERDIPSLIPFVPTYHGTLQMAATLFPAAMVNNTLTPVRSSFCSYDINLISNSLKNQPLMLKAVLNGVVMKAASSV